MGGRQKTAETYRMEKWREKSPCSAKKCVSNKSIGRALGSHSRPLAEVPTRCAVQEVTWLVGWQFGCGTGGSGLFSLGLGSGTGLSSHMAPIIPLWDSWERLAVHTLPGRCVVHKQQRLSSGCSWLCPGLLVPVPSEMSWWGWRSGPSPPTPPAGAAIYSHR